MKAIFCCDWPLFKDKEGNFYDITLTNDILSRYQRVSSELVLLMRVQPIEDESMISKLSKINMDNIRVVELPNLLTVKGLLFKKIQVKKEINSIIKDTDLIFIRVPSFIGIDVVKAAKKYNKPYLVEVGGCAWDAYWNHSIQGKFMAPYMYFKNKEMVKKAQYSTYVTKKFLQKRYPTRGKECACSNVVLKHINYDVLNKRITKIENMNYRNKVVIGTIAAVNVKYKGQQYVIEAISKLNKKGYNFEYHLVGGGDKTFLENYAIKMGVRDSVKFLGIMKKEEIFNFLDSIDIYAQPSKQEGLPRAMIEAMSRACPCIGSTTAGIPELLEEDMIFKNARVNSICEKIIKLFHDKNLLISQAHLNLRKSESYEFLKLENKRNLFFEEYVNFIKNN